MACDCTGEIQQETQKITQQMKSNADNVSYQIKAVTVGENGTGSLDETLYGSTLQTPGQHGMIQPIRFCHWAAPEYDAQGASIWAKAFEAAQVALAITLATVDANIADLNEELAESYYSMAEDKWKRFQNKYMPLELLLLDEVSSVEEPEMGCDDDRSRAENAVNLTYDYMDTFISSRAKMYRMCLDDTDVSQLNFARNKMLVDTENYNLIDDVWFTDYKSDQRWSRRSQVLNLGRNMDSMALQYGDVARSLLKDVGNTVDKAAGSLVSALGYYGARFDTIYPRIYATSTQSMSNSTAASAANGIIGG